jgi:ABC-2 type transport system permease protein
MIFGAGMLQDQSTMTQMQNLGPETVQQFDNNSMIGQIFTLFFNFNWTAMIITFIFFFIGGYLLYASLFAAIGSAVDNETDTQQFMMPVTIPLILAFVAAQGIIQNPEGPLAFWFSIIPFTSPIIMPVRVAMDRYEVWELVLSYGKKVSYKELWKWLRYK